MTENKENLESNSSSLENQKNEDVNNKSENKENEIQKDIEKESKQKINKEREFKINSGNVAIFASSIALVLSAVNKLLRMLVLISGGLIIFLYILSALLSFFALFSCIKNAMKEKNITVDSFFCGISILVLILI